MRVKSDQVAVLLATPRIPADRFVFLRRHPVVFRATTASTVSTLAPLAYRNNMD